MPAHPCDFEVPDACLAESGIVGFVPSSSAFRSTSEAILVPLTSILPPHRNADVAKDWRGMDRARFVSILKGIVAGAEIEPVEGRALAEEEFPPAAYTHRVINGYHRFYASIAAGFPELERQTRGSLGTMPRLRLRSPGLGPSKYVFRTRTPCPEPYMPS